MAQVIDFNPTIAGVRPKDYGTPHYTAYLKQLLLETAEELMHRQGTGGVSSPELYILQRIQELWTSHFEQREAQ